VATALAPSEARWLVEEASGLPASEWASSPASARGAARLSQMLKRRLVGVPLQYVIGHWPFRDLELVVDHRVLIPRPETEVVAEVALAEAVRTGARRGPSDPLGAIEPAYPVADLGTGSGALALALAAELPEAEVWATDASREALAVAGANLAAIGPAATRVRLAEGMWYEALPAGLRGRLRVIVSNPPYVAEAEFDALPREVRDHEPRRSLVAGPTGLEALEVLVAGGPDWLAPGGALVLELAPHQATAVAASAHRAGFAGVELRRDLAGRNRVLVARSDQG
jgi:release factor glutamine methyltransferase